MSPAKDKTATHASRSKAKKDAELTTELQKVVSNLGKVLAEPQATEEATPEIPLGREIAMELSRIKNQNLKPKWRRNFRMQLCEMESEFLDYDDKE